jgi:hypothetical protein
MENVPGLPLVVVGVAQRVAATVLVRLVAAIAQPVVCVPRAAGAACWPGGRWGGLSGRCEGYLVFVELQ